jgi:hypothetical protein
LIKEEFLKKIETLYIKQLMIVNLNEASNAEDSMN